MRREELLHHPGGVGADHQHLAVRHVDDAHEPEGDGEPQAHDEQHGAQAQAVEQVADDAPEEDEGVDALDRDLHGLPRRAVGFALEHGPELGQRRLGAQPAERAGGVRPGGGDRSQEPELREGLLEHRPGARVAFLLEGPREHRDRREIVGTAEFEGGRPARLGIAREDLQALENRLHPPEGGLLERDRLLPLPRHDRLPATIQNRPAGQVPERAVVAEDGHPGVPAVEGAVLQGPQERLHGRVGQPAERGDRGRLRRRRGELPGDRLEIGAGGPGGGGRPPGYEASGRDEQRDRDERDYFRSESHTCFPSTKS